MPYPKKKHYIVKKRGGEEELFIPQKLCNSIVAIGASDALAQQVCDIVEENIESGTSTDEIFTKTRRYLQKYNPQIAGLYALERALSALGPSGFLFEQYIGHIFSEMQYKVSTNVYVPGEGVSHEIDVIAEKGKIVNIIEAKYRNDHRTKTPVDQVMYADARIEDIKRKAQKNGDQREYYMWVITNTQFSESSVTYVKYRDVQLMGWDFPRFINLKKIVSEKKLYPVTVLSSITASALKAFAQDGMVLVKSLQRYTADDLRAKYGFSRTLSLKLEREISELVYEEYILPE